MGTTVPAITERQTRQINPGVLPEVKANVQEAVESGVEPEEAITQAIHATSGD